jgi:hypothetical protein
VSIFLNLVGFFGLSGLLIPNQSIHINSGTVRAGSFSTIVAENFNFVHQAHAALKNFARRALAISRPVCACEHTPWSRSASSNPRGKKFQDDRLRASERKSDVEAD